MQVQLHKTEEESPHVERGCYTAPLQNMRGWLTISTSDGHFALHNLDPAQMIALGERITNLGRRFEAELLSRPHYVPRAVQGPAPEKWLPLNADSKARLGQGPPFDSDGETRCRTCKDVTDEEELSSDGDCPNCHLAARAAANT